MPSSTAKATTNATTVFSEPPLLAAAVATATGDTFASGVVVDSIVGVHCCETVPGGLALGVPTAEVVAPADGATGARETVGFTVGDGLTTTRDGDGLAFGLTLGLGAAVGVAVADPDAEPEGDGLLGDAGTMEGTGPAKGRAALAALVRPPRSTTEPTTQLITVAAKTRGTYTVSW